MALALSGSATGEPFKLRPHPPRFLVPRSLQRERRVATLLRLLLFLGGGSPFRFYFRVSDLAPCAAILDLYTHTPRGLQSSRLWIAGPTATYTGYAGVHTPLSGVEMKKAYGGQCQRK